MKPKRKPPEIEFQKVIGESGAGDYRMIRQSRVKYRKNPYTFVDIRTFQRGYDENDEDVYHPTQKGVQLLESRKNQGQARLLNYASEGLANEAHLSCRREAQERLAGSVGAGG